MFAYVRIYADMCGYVRFFGKMFMREPKQLFNMSGQVCSAWPGLVPPAATRAVTPQRGVPTRMRLHFAVLILKSCRILSFLYGFYAIEQ
jgi:hypothetical protein